MTPFLRFPRAWTITVLVLTLLASALSLTGCTQPSLPGQLGQLQRLASGCPKDGRKVAGYVAVDATGSDDSPAYNARALAIIDAVAVRALVCGGHLQASFFASSSGGNSIIIDEDLPALPGTTQIARLRQAPLLLKKLDAQIAADYQPAMSRLVQAGSDITGQLRLVGDYQQSLGAGYVTNATLVTDGEQNVGFDILSRSLTPAQAKDLAAHVPDVPSLSGASLIFTGLGQTAGAAAPSTALDGLVDFYRDLCARTHAAKCLAVTTLPKGGGDQ